MEGLQNQTAGQEDIMKKLQAQMSGENNGGKKAQKQIKNARNNISPFERQAKPPAEQSSATEIPQSVYDFGEKIIKAPVKMAREMPNAIYKNTRPALAQGDETFKNIALSWKAKVKGFFSGIGGFFKSVLNSKSKKK